jgi:hypothetical protein
LGLLLVGALGQLQRLFLVAPLDRIRQEATHAEELGLRPLQHLLELELGHVLLALELRRLRGEQERRGARIEQLLGLLGVHPGPGHVAGGSRDQPMGQLLVAAQPRFCSRLVRICRGSPTTQRQTS